MRVKDYLRDDKTGLPESFESEETEEKADIVLFMF